MSEYQWAAGQVVFVPANRGWGGFPGRKAVIDRVTPSGRAYIGSTGYDRHGREIGGTRYNRDWIVPLTEAHEKAISDFKAKSEMLNIVEAIKWRDLTPEQIEAITPHLRKLTEHPA